MRRRAGAPWRRGWPRQKQPDMGALAGAGTFQREWDTVRTANARNSAGTVLPVGVIEVQRQQIAGLVRQHGVQTDNIPPLCISPGQVTVDGCVIQWAQHAVRAFGAGHTPFLTQAGLPFVGADRAVAAFLRLFAVPAQGVDVGAAAEQGAKQANFLGGGLARVTEAVSAWQNGALGALHADVGKSVALAPVFDALAVFAGLCVLEDVAPLSFPGAGPLGSNVASRARNSAFSCSSSCTLCRRRWISSLVSIQCTLHITNIR